MGINIHWLENIGDQEKDMERVGDQCFCCWSDFWWRGVGVYSRIFESIYCCGWLAGRGVNVRICPYIIYTIYGNQYIWRRDGGRMWAYMGINILWWWVGGGRKGRLQFQLSPLHLQMSFALKIRRFAKLHKIFTIFAESVNNCCIILHNICQMFSHLQIWHFRPNPLICKFGQISELNICCASDKL